MPPIAWAKLGWHSERVIVYPSWVQRQLGRDRAKTGQACLVSFLVIPMQRLRDKARELVGLAEAALLEKEATILALRRELARVTKDLAAVNAQQRAAKSPKCEGCTYKIIALKALEEKEQVKK